MKKNKLEIQNIELMDIKSVEYVQYEFNNKIYKCIFYMNDIWVNAYVLNKLTLNCKEELTDVLNGIIDNQNNGDYKEFCLRKWYFMDGNTQAFKSDLCNYYNIDCCILFLTKDIFKNVSENLRKYIFWAKTTLVGILSNDSNYLFSNNLRKCFVIINNFKHGVRDVIVPHKHNCYEICYYYEGSGNVSCEKGIFEYKKDSIFVASPNIIHEEFITEESGCICLGFNTDIKFPTGILYINEVNSNDVKTIFEYLNLILDVKNNEEVDCEDYVMLIIYLLNKLINLSEKKKHFFDNTVDYVKKYIDINYSSKINFTLLSEKVGYSLSRLNALFREKEGQTIFSYLCSIRLLHAKEFLKKDNYNLAIISKKCGFTSESRFSQFFKEKTGVAPLVYRKIIDTEIASGVLIEGKIKK